MTEPFTLSRQVGPWPDRARAAPREPGCAAPSGDTVFPSGRAAILACLDLLGIASQGVIATPECVTACVDNAVRRRARPVHVRAAVSSGSRPAAAIVYEQWGWPLSAPAEDAIRDEFDGVPVIVDRVDSADFFFARRTFGAFEVLSLSKVLGLDAGGFARRDAEPSLLRFGPGPAERPAPGDGRPRLVSHPAVRELFKQSQFVHPAAAAWLADNCALRAVEAERAARSTAARLILDSPIGAQWPDWMAGAIESGAGPVWAPVLRGGHTTVHRLAIGTLERQLGVRAAVRMFNWTGNPLSPRFEPSVALPIHSQLVSPAEAVSVLRQTRPGGP